MAGNLLNRINSPQDLKELDLRELEVLCEEIRQFLIEKVSKTGGHLSSNLGMVELTVALHYCLNSPIDKIVFDVGHQCYTHKILTGRKSGFDKLRVKDGLSGFPAPSESEHDVFVVGHSSTSISSAAGLARAKKINGEPGYVIAIIGDGAFTGGMVYEGLNNVEDLNNLIVILNDNKMSISKNNSSLAQYLTKLRTNPQYYKAKTDLKTVLSNTPVFGKSVKKSIQSVKSAVRRGIYNSTFFEELGFTYVGPVDGHNLEELYALFSNLDLINKPLFVYLESVKGKGFVPAEKNPGAFHGVSAFNLAKIKDPDVSSSDSFSIIFGQTLARLAVENKKICGITAAMKYGTGLQYLKKNCPERFFDVGIAEEHAVTFASGLSKGGMLPVVCIYSTFMQRAYDQIIHDVMLQESNLIFAVDRAGLVPNDGETHQGIYDAAYFSQQSDMLIVSPANYSELRYWLKKLVSSYNKPRVIRYPKGSEPLALKDFKCTGQSYDCMKKTRSKKTAIISYGVISSQVIEAAESLKNASINVAVYKMLQINPIDYQFIDEILLYKHILFVEEGIKQGGIAEHVAACLLERGFKGDFEILALNERGISHATKEDLQKECGLDKGNIVKTVKEFLNGKNKA